MKVVEGGEVALAPENIHVITTFYEVRPQPKMINGRKGRKKGGSDGKRTGQW